MRDTLNIIKTIVGIKNYEIYSLDIKNAFLQGDKSERDVFMKPPPEYSVPGTLWRLRKSVYGMVEAARKWWDRISQRLTEIKCTQSKLDPCLFIISDKSGKLTGLIVIFVDDLKIAGSRELCEMMIRDIGKSFEIGRVEKNEFVYTGLNVKKTGDGITTDQVKYINDLKPAIFDSRDKHRYLNREEKKLYRQKVGQINWCAVMTRPDLSFSMVSLSTRFTRPVVADLLECNKVIAHAQREQVMVKHSKLEGDIKITAFGDAGLGNIGDVHSGGGKLILLEGNNKKVAPLAWSCNKIRRVCNNTLSAETLIAYDTLSHAIYLRAMVAEILGVNPRTIPIRLFSDSKNMTEHLQTISGSSKVRDKRLHIDLSAIAEMTKRDNVQVVWVDGSKQLANVLTKKGAGYQQILEVLRSGSLKSLES